MIPRLREEYDADRIKPNEPTECKTPLNRYELNCGVCGKRFYVDEETLRDFENRFKHDLDNQFICSECELEYENLAFE